jgi:hypothetical protein
MFPSGSDGHGPVSSDQNLPRALTAIVLSESSEGTDPCVAYADVAEGRCHTGDLGRHRWRG